MMFDDSLYADVLHYVLKVEDSFEFSKFIEKVSLDSLNSTKFLVRGK